MLPVNDVGGHPHPEPRPMFPLVRHFSLTSLIGFVLVATVLGALYRWSAIGDLIAIGESKNIALTQAFSNSLWSEFSSLVEQASDFSIEQLQRHPDIDRLHQLVLAQMSRTSVVKVKVYDRSGMTVFSTEARQIGEDKRSNPGYQSALNGIVMSDLTHRDTFNAFDGEIEHRDVISSYVPIHDENGQVQAVIEVYDDVSLLLWRINDTQRNLIIGVVVTLTTLYAILLAMVKHGERIIIREKRDRELAEITLRESSSRYEAVMKQSTACIFLVDVLTLRILEANMSFQNLLGYTEIEIQALTLYDFVAHEHESIHERVQLIRTHGSHLIGERRYRARDGRLIDVDVRVNLIHYGGKEVMCVVSNDISTRKRTDVQLRASLVEKEVLLKEIHHRVKNNLQIISSLLNLQSPHLQDPLALAQFQDSQNRIRTMALIHERLYRSDDLARIDFGTYLRDLTAHLLASYQAQRNGVTLKVETDDIFLDIDTAIPCGLLVNELVSNALKHAFPNGREGEISVEMRCNGGEQYRLVVCDDGVGMSEGVDYRKASSLGLKLVNSLARQLGGTVDLHGGVGTTFVIIFHIPHVDEIIQEEHLT